MRKLLNFCMVLTAALFLAGCGNDFEPTESTIYVTSKGIVHSAIMESFEKDYYNFEELKGDVETAVQSYCANGKEGAVSVESLVEENDVVTLKMQYQTVADYSTFNDMILFSGSFSEAEAAGYVPSELYDSEGKAVVLSEEEKNTLKVVVTEESVCVQTSGTIKCVSDNVTVIDKKLASAMEAGAEHLAFIVYK